MQWLQKNVTAVVKFYDIGLESSQLITYTNATISTNKDHTSKLGYIIWIADNSEKCSVIHYRSAKCSRIAEPVPGFENYASADGSDYPYAFRNDLKTTSGQDILLKIDTDLNVSLRCDYNIIYHKRNASTHRYCGYEGCVR